MKTILRLLKDNSGATAVEYGLLASLISIAMLVGLQSFSDSLLDILNTITTAVVNAGK